MKSTFHIECPFCDGEIRDDRDGESTFLLHTEPACEKFVELDELWDRAPAKEHSREILELLVAKGIRVPVIWKRTAN